MRAESERVREDLLRARGGGRACGVDLLSERLAARIAERGDPIKAPTPQPDPARMSLSDSEWSLLETGVVDHQERSPEEPGGVASEGPGARLAGARSLGPYRIVRILGRGGMGAVFEVEHAELGVRYALKTILASRRSPGFKAELARFRREAELSARLDHPGLLTVHSAALEGAAPYLVVDLLSGGSLGDRIDQGRIASPAEAISWGLELARALKHAHGRGVLHRDLKPENVMLDEFGAPRLIDYGLALEAERATRVTDQGVVLGTPATMAPEQIQAEHGEGPPTDVYGLAATLYWVLSGDPPLGVEACNLTELMVTILEGKPEPLSRLRSDVPAALSDLLAASLRKDPGERPSLDEWLRVLEGLRQGQGQRSSAGVLGKALVAASVVGGVILGWVALDQGKETSRPAPSAPGGAAKVSPRDWRVAQAEGAVGESRRLLLRGSGPLGSGDLRAAAALLSSGSVGAGDLATFEARLGSLEDEDRGGLWALACLEAGEAARGRQHARLGSEARALIEVELERARTDREEVIPRLTKVMLVREKRDAGALYESVLNLLRAWPAERVVALGVANEALALRILDRVQWTLARLLLVRSLDKRFAGAKATDPRVSKRVFEGAPNRPGPGRLAFEIGLLGDQGLSGHRQRFALYQRARPYESVFMADPGGRTLYAGYAVHYGREPLEALRLGGVACNSGGRAIVPVDSYACRSLPELVVRGIEAEWLGLDLSRAPRGVAEVRGYLGEILGAKRRRAKRVYPALAIWHLYRREFAAVQKALVEARAFNSRDLDYAARLTILEGELELARDPLGAAQGVLERLKGVAANDLEYFGLRAHARALLGLDVRAELAEIERKHQEGFARLGLPWHAFEVAAVIAGDKAWPGRPGTQPSALSPDR